MWGTPKRANSQAVRDALLRGERDYAKLEQAATAELERHGWRPDYVAVRRQSDLQEPQLTDHQLVVLSASHLGTTRLIDNVDPRSPR